MKLPGTLAGVLSLALLGTAPLPIVYTSPAGNRPAGAPHAADPFDVILPDGRIVAPVGKSVVVGDRALGVALSPDGKYAFVSNDASGNASITVVSTASMTVTDTHREKSLFQGIVALKDPANPKATLVLASAGTGDAVRLLRLNAFGMLRDIGSILVDGDPAAITLAPNHRTAYVVSNIGDTVTAIDLRTRAVLGAAAVGYFPWDAAVAGSRLYVTDPGLMQYGKLPQPQRQPQFANAPFEPQFASALTSLQLTRSGSIDPAASVSTRMDIAPDGVQNVGGAQPTAIAISKNGAYAYVCMTNVDRIAVVDLLGIPRVVHGLQLRLFDRSPYGAQPDAIVRSPDGKRLYVALAGMNAVAVLDAQNHEHLHRMALIPTGWYPAALAISSNGRYLYVANAKGMGHATLQKIDLKALTLARLTKTTYSALRYLRVEHPHPAANEIVPPLRTLQRSSVIQHVVSISLDQTGAPGPNLQAIGDAFARATNFYELGGASLTAQQFASAGLASAYSEKTLRGQDPEDYPRDGYIFNDAARAGRTFRDYGMLLRLSGYVPSGARNADGLGGMYTLSVPALAALQGHVDLNYAGWNPRLRDMERAKEFIRDYARLEQQNAVPDFSDVWLPQTDAQDGDAALGAIVDFLTHQPSWNTTAIFITAGNTALVASPYSKHGFSADVHLSSASVLKTEEELLGLAPLSLGDLLTSDFSGFFTETPDLTSYTAK